MQKWKVCLTFESEGNILMESKLYILEGNKMKNRLEEIRKERGIRQEELARALEVSALWKTGDITHLSCWHLRLRAILA